MPTHPLAEPRDLAELLDPTNDAVFKLLLAGPDSRDVLAYVLRGVHGANAAIEDFVVLDPALGPAHLDAKAIALDVRVRLADGTQVDVEMQCLPTRAFRERLVYYAARGLAAQLQAGDGYVRLRPSIVVAFLGYDEFREPGFHKVFAHREVTHGYPFADVLVIHTLELPKLRPLDVVAGSEQDPLVLFSRFLTARTREELTALALEEPAMKQALDILQRLSADATARQLAADREARRRLDEMYRQEELEEARAEAEAIGVAKGEARARAMLLVFLQQRFGPLDDAHLRAVHAASPEQVDRWAESVLAARSLDELLAS